MKKYKRIIILINLIILLGLFNNSMLQKEELLLNGQLILLELAPVDPRSLMQGDYMRLRYSIFDNINDSMPKRGFCVVKLVENGMVKAVRRQKNKTPINDNEFLIKCMINRRRSNINIGAESYFFQEGEGYKYENAKYGGIKVDNQGNSLLIGLYDKNQKKIE